MIYITIILKYLYFVLFKIVNCKSIIENNSFNVKFICGRPFLIGKILVIFINIS